MICFIYFCFILNNKFILLTIQIVRWMIKIEHVAFIANLAGDQHGGRQESNDAKNWQDKLRLLMYIMDDNAFENLVVQCVLVKEKSFTSHGQLRYQPEVKEKQYTIKLPSRPKLQKDHPIKLVFQLRPYHQLESPITITQHPNLTFSRGFLDLSNSNCSNLYTVAVLDKDQNFVKGYLSCKYQILDSNNSLLNAHHSNNSVPIYIFGIKIFIHGSRHKRAFLTVSQPQQTVTKPLQFQTIQNQQSIFTNTKKLPIRRVQKGWLWYKDATEIQLTTNSLSSALINLTLYNFDFNSCQTTYICSYKGELFLGFDQGPQIKFLQLEMIDQRKGSEEVVASVEFRYCQKTEDNLDKLKGMLSSSYLENAFSPAQFVYDNSSFISNASLVKNRPANQSLNASFVHSPIHSPLLNLNKSNRNIFVKSKFHSSLSSNRGIPMDKQQRFPSPKKKLTDQLGYYAHRTLDINQLPQREKYKFSSFGKDTKECLKVNAHSRAGPGAGRYRLPSVFDKY